MASDILHNYFQSVECDNSQLIVKFKPSGQRYIVEKSKNSFKSAYNQSFEIFAGDKVVFRGKNSSLTVESVLYDKSTEKQRSFLSKNNISASYICNVHSFNDMRSTGRGIEKKTYFLVPISDRNKLSNEISQYLHSCWYLLIPEDVFTK